MRMEANIAVEAVFHSDPIHGALYFCSTHKSNIRAVICSQTYSPNPLQVMRKTRRNQSQMNAHRAITQIDQQCALMSSVESACYTLQYPYARAHSPAVNEIN